MGSGVRDVSRASSRVPAFWLATVLLALPFGASAAATTYDFESFAEGEIVGSTDLPGATLTVLTGSCPDVAIIFDSDCSGSSAPDPCTGEDLDLQTPGSGPGNDTAQFNILIFDSDCPGGCSGGEGA